MKSILQEAVKANSCPRAKQFAQLAAVGLTFKWVQKVIDKLTHNQVLTSQLTSFKIRRARAKQMT